MTIVNKIKQLCESVTGLPFLYDSMGGLNVLLDNADYPCVYCTLLETTSVTNENGNIVEGVRVALVVCDKTEFDVGSIENESIIENCKAVANNILRNIRLTGALVLDSINEAQRFYEQYDVLLTGYALNLNVSEIYGDTGCDIEPITITITENGEYDVTGVQKAVVAVPELSEKEQLLNYFRKGGNSLAFYQAQTNFDLDLSEFTALAGTSPVSSSSTRRIIFNGELRLPSGINWGARNTSIFYRAFVKKIIFPQNTTLPLVDSTMSGEEFIAEHCKGGGWGTSQSLQYKKIDIAHFTYTPEGWESSPPILNNIKQCVWLDISYLTKTNWGTSHNFPTVSNNCTTFIGDREDEPYDASLTIYTGCTRSFTFNSDKNNLGWKSVMAMANGVADVTNIGTRTAKITTTLKNKIINAGMLEIFEQTLIDKGWTIVYQ